MNEASAVRRITITEPSGETAEQLVHIFRQPSAADWSEFGAEIGRAKNCKEQLAVVAVCFYNFLGLAVEGYVAGEIPLMTAYPDDWKRFIPPNHKARAIVELLKITVDETQKILLEALNPEGIGKA